MIVFINPQGNQAWKQIGQHDWWCCVKYILAQFRNNVNRFSYKIFHNFENALNFLKTYILGSGRYLHSFSNAGHKMQWDWTMFAVSMGNMLQWLRSTAVVVLKQYMSFDPYHSLHQLTNYQSQVFPPISSETPVSVNSSLRLLYEPTNFYWKYLPNRRPWQIGWLNIQNVENDTKLRWH